jgi:RecA-family ATPase
VDRGAGILTARQSLYARGDAGNPLPDVFKALSDKGTRFLRGQVVLVVAPAGAGKSAFILSYAVKAKVSTLYFSADSDPFTQLSRMLSIEFGWPLARSTEMVRTSQLGEAAARLDDIPIRFSYAASPTLDDIELELDAYCELYGDYPELVIIDNLTNVVTAQSEEDPFSGLESLLDYLHGMARATGSCVVPLHHVTGPYNDAAKPIPLSGVKGQISRVPEMILTLHRVPQTFGSDSLRVSTVKNRSAKADPSGQDYAELTFQGDTMSIT